VPLFLKTRNTMNAPLLASASSLVALTCIMPAAQAQDAPPAAPAVVTIVKIAKPANAPAALVRSKMRETVDLYGKLPGLDFKAFSLARPDSAYGGIYSWRDRAAAQAWFNPAWFERVRQERGVEGQVRFFEAWLSIDNSPGGTAADNDSKSVATLVEIALPAGVGNERLWAEFKAAVPTYQKLPGLLRKHFIVSGEGAERRFGGVYLWRDEASAQAWFSAAWQERVRSTYGAPASVEWFDTPVLLPTLLRGAVQSQP
jgi:heme-degrading monooxygenase HmoA